jgi:sugar lactone lactonase YvrE
VKKIIAVFGFVCMAIGSVHSQAWDSAPAGLVSWWRADGNVNDSIGANTGILVNGATFAAGKVGQAFRFNGATQYVGIPQSPSLNTFSNQMTIEFWMYAAPGNSMATFQGLVTSDYYGIEISSGLGFGANGVNWYVNTRNGAYLISNVNGGGIPVSAGQWHHIAGTYDGNQLQLYIDGLPRGNPEPASGTILPMLVNSFVAIGSDDGRSYCGCTGRYFRGLIDEASIYNRALSAGEIASIYNADSAGKCPLPATGPVILTQPTNRTVTAGGTAAFGVVVSGTGPFTYQWLFNGNIITPKGIISTVAGNGLADYSGDGGAATNAGLRGPVGVAVDASGDLFIGDAQNSRIRKVDADGIITTVAGSGNYGYSGDGGVATNASLAYPDYATFDAAGALYLVDGQNHRIRKVNADGIISTVAGNGIAAYSGDGGAATNASLCFPNGVAFDVSGNMFIADWGNNRIRKVDTNGVITTIAGIGPTYPASAGFSGDGGAATDASLNGPVGVAFDASGNLFIGDTRNDRVRKVDTNGIITTVVGGGNDGLGDGGAATNASLNTPNGVAFDACGNLFIGDTGNNRVRRVDANGIITTVAGGGTEVLGDGGSATNATLSGPQWVAFDRSGNLLVADCGNGRIRKVGSGGLPTLTLSNVTTNNAGNYQVIVTGPCGSITSSVAQLTVNPSATSGPAPSGIVAWWRAQGNADDSIGANDGMLINGASFAAGKVGQAFSFDGIHQYVKVPRAASLNSFSNQLTIEFWMYANPSNLMNTYQGLVTSDYYGIEISDGYGGNVGLNWYLNTITGEHLISTVNGGGIPVSSGQWHHVAGTYDGAKLELYVDGVAIGNAQAASGAILPMLTNSFVAIGSDDGRTYCGCTGRYFRGLIDEASIYSRALPAGEIAAIYSAGSAGKCPLSTNYVSGAVVSPPQPLLETRMAGANLQLAWPISKGAFLVQSADSPVGPWTDTTFTSITNGASVTVTVAATNQQQYFRLVGR